MCRWIFDIRTELCVTMFIVQSPIVARSLSLCAQTPNSTFISLDVFQSYKDKFDIIHLFARDIETDRVLPLLTAFALNCTTSTDVSAVLPDV